MTCWVRPKESRRSRNWVVVETEGSSMWMLKSPLMMSSEGVEMTFSIRVENSDRKTDLEEEGGR